MKMSKNWQWCDICYGQTIHKNEKCTQCKGHKSIVNRIDNLQAVAVITDKNGQVALVSEYSLNLN